MTAVTVPSAAAAPPAALAENRGADLAPALRQGRPDVFANESAEWAYLDRPGVPVAAAAAMYLKQAWASVPGCPGFGAAPRAAAGAAARRGVAAWNACRRVPVERLEEAAARAGGRALEEAVAFVLDVADPALRPEAELDAGELRERLAELNADEERAIETILLAYLADGRTGHVPLVAAAFRDALRGGVSLLSQLREERLAAERGLRERAAGEGRKDDHADRS